MQDTDFAAAVAELRAAIPPLVLARLRAVHDERWADPYGCPARAEGERCCMDLLLGDTATD